MFKDARQETQQEAGSELSHLKQTQIASGPPAIERGLQLLFTNYYQKPGWRKAALALFQNKITWAGLRHWRCGRRPVPQWAADTLSAELKKKAAAFSAAALALEDKNNLQPPILKRKDIPCKRHNQSQI